MKPLKLQCLQLLRLDLLPLCLLSYLQDLLIHTLTLSASVAAIHSLIVERPLVAICLITEYCCKITSCFQSKLEMAAKQGFMNGDYVFRGARLGMAQLEWMNS